MKYKLLRYNIRRFVKPNRVELKDCTLVFDGRCLRGEYRKSGCESLLGGELDRYASHLRAFLQALKDNNVTCYFIFKGGRIVDTETRTEIYQDLINTAASVAPGNTENIDPPFVKDVHLELLTEFRIKWFIAEYDSQESLLTVARNYDCPIMTNNLEFCLYGVSCIQWQSITKDVVTGETSFDMYEAEACGRAFLTNKSLISAYLTLVDEDEIYFKKIPGLTKCRKYNEIPGLLWWIRRKTRYDVEKAMMKELDIDSWEDFRKTSQQHYMMLDNQLNDDAVKYFQDPKPIDLHSNDNKWFIKGVCNGRIPVAYINLYHNRTFSGSWLIQDENRDDAMLPAMEIVKYALGLLTNFKNTKITFFGRKSDKCSSWEIEFRYEYEPHMADQHLIKKSLEATSSKLDFFQNFIVKVIPGFSLQLLQTMNVPEDCWILMITLVFYCLKNPDYLIAYSFLLCYVMLGPVTDKVGLIKHSNFDLSHNEMKTTTADDKSQNLTVETCVKAAKKLKELFYINQDLENKFDRSVLHYFSEFQHCLQHMNHLNKLCGERIKNTVYHKTINATFAFNAYQKMKGDEPLQYFEDQLKGSVVLELFTSLVGVFEQLVQESS